MASNPTATLSKLLSSTAIEDHEEVLKAANAILKKSKTDQDALHTRVVALLKLDRYEDALRALDDGGDRLAERCAFEKAYALYKTGQLEAAQRIFAAYNILGSNTSAPRGLQHVAAQVAYRVEKFEEAGEIYRGLSGQEAAIEDEENDLRINSLAVDVQLEWQGNGDKVEKSRKLLVREDLEAFETTYNAACGCVARGDFGAGSVLLKRARDLCEALDELTDEEKRAEILPIMVQQAYVFTKIGKLHEAETIQKMIDISDIPEAPTKLIAQNNLLASQEKHDNPYLAQRSFESTPTLKATEKLFEYQASIIKRNRYAIDLRCLKYDGVARSTAQVLAENPSPTTSAYVNGLSAINAATHTKCGSDKANIKELLSLLEKRPNDVGLVLTIIQLYILAHNPGAATALLESFFKRLEELATPSALDVRFAPGLVALIVSLYRLQGRKGPIKAQLGNAASYWSKKSAPSEDLLKAAGLTLLESSNPADLKAAADFFGSLREKDPADPIAVAGYIAAVATTDLSLVSADLTRLSPIDKLIGSTDAAALEDAGIASLPLTMTEIGRKRAAAPAQEKPKKKRVRRSERPKDYVEGRQMDPERWLPLKDRSTYRPKGKKGKKKAAEATQGGVVREEETMELAGGAGVVKVQTAPSKAGKKKKGKK